MSGLREKVINIVEEKSIESSSPVVLEGFPNVGLVGAISLSFLIKRLDFQEVGWIESDFLPPVVAVHEDGIKELMRLYAKDDLLAVFSETPIPMAMLRPFVSELGDWIASKKPRLVFSFGGIAEPRRLETEKPKVVVVSNRPQALTKVKKPPGLNTMREGYLAGVQALMLKETAKRGIDMLALLAQAYPNYPDPGAAAQLLEFAGEILGFEVDVSPLLESADEVKIQMRDLMRRTQQSMVPMQKSKEMELPPVYL